MGEEKPQAYLRVGMVRYSVKRRQAVNRVSKRDGRSKIRGINGRSKFLYLLAGISAEQKTSEWKSMGFLLTPSPTLPNVSRDPSGYLGRSEKRSLNQHLT